MTGRRALSAAGDQMLSKSQSSLIGSVGCWPANGGYGAITPNTIASQTPRGERNAPPSVDAVRFERASSAAGLRFDDHA